MDEKTAKQFVKNAILTGNKEYIARVVEHYNKAYGQSRPNEIKKDLPIKEHMDVDPYQEAVKLFGE